MFENRFVPKVNSVELVYDVIQRVWSIQPSRQAGVVTSRDVS